MDGRTDSDRLLDLLYGELSAKEEEEVRRRLDEEPKLAEEYEELRAARQEVSDQIPEPEEMPNRVRDSILDRAAEQHQREPKRRQSGAGPDRGWSFGPSTSVGLKVGLSVAVALLVAGAVYVVMGQAGFFEEPAEDVAMAEGVVAAEEEAVADE